MLQQILQDMYIEPELLAELSEEQKQTLFCKMREEQVRKWREWEEEQDKLEKKKKNAPKKTSKKQLNWLLAQDGDVWVWVMGDHPEDKSIEYILQQEAQKEAQKQAEKEAEELRKKEEEEMAKKLKEEQERIEAEKKQKEEELRKKAEEAALYESLKEARELAKKVEEERKKSYEEERKKLKLVREKSEIRRRKSTENLRKMKEKRTSELYMKIEDVRKKFSALAEESGKKIEQDWKEQEKKVKQVDAERRLIARKAREEHRASLRSTATAITAFKSLAISGVSQLPETTNKESNKPINNNLKSHDRKRAARPKNRDEVVRWFRESEQPRGSGLDQDTGKIAPWFHGIISRQDAEDLLEDEKVGTYLMRVSERVWGYAISYRGQERCKHFLIDTSDDTYQFFGTNQIAHEQLADIVLFHQSRAISSLGQEILRYPCGQSVDPPDYYELFQDTGTTVTAL